MDKTRLNLADATGEGPPHSGRELRSLGGYHLLRRLGEGGMGSVYLAFKEGAGEPVALKVLSDHLINSPGFVDRFYREARNGACLDHPNIVRSYLADQDPATGKHFLVLEYIEGDSAQTLLDQRGHLSVGDAAYIVLGVARALEHAHSRHIIHRDIKPDNILLTRTGLPKLADLGLAKKLDDNSHLTATRQGFGTTPYMPYEQAMNARYADARSDIYALGATFYHLITGVVPFQGRTDLEVIEKKNQGDYPLARSHNSALPEQLDQLLARMLARKPRDRYQSATELIHDLEASGLAAQHPSFVEPRSEPADSSAQTSIGSATAPTRISMELLARAGSSEVVAASSVWFLRYHGRDGRLCQGRATTGQIIERVQAGQLPAGVEARRHSQDDFQPLIFFPEFRILVTGKLSPHIQLGEETGSPSPWLLLAAVSSLVLGLLAGLAALGCLPM